MKCVYLHVSFSERYPIGALHPLIVTGVRILRARAVASGACRVRIRKSCIGSCRVHTVTPTCDLAANRMN